MSALVLDDRTMVDSWWRTVIDMPETIHHHGPRRRLGVCIYANVPEEDKKNDEM